MESDPGLEEEPSTYPYQAPSVALFRRICLFLHEYPAVWVFGGLYLLYLVRTHLPKLKKAWQHRAEARKEKLPKPSKLDCLYLISMPMYTQRFKISPDQLDSQPA
eukprot:1145007-Pelagomonas_calceolata.AAC.4